jgi:subtilisin family serine protease
MIANGSDMVNAVRAERCGSVAVRNAALLRRVAPQRGRDAVPIERSALPKRVSRGRLRELPADVLASVFIRTVGATAPAAFPGQTARKANLTAATVSMKQLGRILEDDTVMYVEVGEPLATPMPIVAAADGPPVGSLRRVAHSRKHRGGQGVLIGLVDVGGFDFSHSDLVDRHGDTRFVRIWDQGGASRPSPAAFGYGAELTRSQLNAAIRAAPAVGLPPWELEPQSQMAESSHGTHVASIAAGNRGVCPRALIAGVVISMSEEEQDRRRSFSDSTRVAHAVDYLLGVAKEENVKAIAINISLGTNGHAHDASSAVNRWIEAELMVPGRAVCVAAGNSGQAVPEYEGDRGFVVGRIHTSGAIPARGLSADIEWIVVGNGVADLSENELELWYSPQDRFNVWVRPPEGRWIGPIEPRQFIENQELADGSFLSVYNELYHPANGSNYISIYLSPFFSEAGVVGIAAGQWTVRLEGIEVKDGRYHGWIERDDPRRLGRIGPKEAWSFPSFFTPRSNVDNSSVSSLGCGHRIISVANLDRERQRIHGTSSQGPTRDGRCKPDVAAPGTDIVAANGFADPGTPWVSMTGTSMASPFVAGVVGLMLAVNPKLTAAQIEGIIQRTARPLPGSSYTWLNDAGYGIIDPDACLVEAELANTRVDLTP